MSWPVCAINPQNPAIGARPIALGRAFAGLADDASAIYVNPAGLARINSYKLLNLYATPFPNNNLMVISGAVPDFFGLSAGFGYTNNSTSGITMNLPDTVEVTYTEQEFLLSFAGWSTENISTALTLNLLTKGFSYDSPLLVGNRGFGFDIDLGMQYRPNEKIGIGLVLQDALPAFLGGKFYYDSQAWEDIPSNLRVGAAFNFTPRFTFLLDFDKAITRALPLLAHTGVEWKANDYLSVRSGLDQTPTGQNNATDAYTHLTFGLGVKVRGITFDYAYYKRGDPSGKVTNYISLGYVGEPESKKIETTPEAEKVVPLSELLPPRVTRQQFSDIPEAYPAREAIEILATAGIMPGYLDGTFKPNNNISRQEVENILATAKRINPALAEDPDKALSRAEAVKELVGFDKILVDLKVRATPYRDVPSEHWAAPYIAAALAQGILAQENDFRPDDAITRAEFSQMLANTSLGRAIIKRLR